MTYEEKCLELINYCTRYPYELTPQELAKLFQMPRTVVYKLCFELRLEAKGFRGRDRQRAIRQFIMDNPFMTAAEVLEITGEKSHVVYGVAKQMRHRFETKYSRIEQGAYHRKKC
jgi:hypothetical protein